jgi:hypothetical protein
MGHHYIPQYYLKGFASPGDDMIWVYEKGGSLKFSANIKKIAQKTNYYSPEVERYLTNEIENPANSVIKKIRDCKKLTQSEKEKLTIYMVVMLKRVLQSKIRMKKTAPVVVQSLQQKWDKEISKLILENPSQTEILEKRRAEIKTNFEKYSKNISKDFWLDLIPPERTPNIVKVIPEMRWLFLTCEKFPAFLTCDNPVFYFQGIGIGKPESEITFPISSNIVLWATWRSSIQEGYSPIKNQAIKEINRRTATNATRFIYHAKDEDWIPRFINKQEHQLNLFG